MTRFSTPRHRYPQRGLALLTMLLVTALVALLATTLLVQQDRLLTQAGQVDRYYLRKARALGEEARLLAELRADQAGGDPVDGMDAPWLTPRTEAEAGVRIERHTRALDALLNINNLATAAALGRFQRLLKQLELDPNLAFQLADWIDADEEARPGGAEDGFYGDEDPPRRAGNTPFPTESAIPEGASLSQQAWLKLRPLVAALPPTFEQVNVNLAPPEVLATLAPGLEPNQVWPLAQPALPWTSVGAVIGSQAAFAPEEGVLATVSQFFETLILVEAQGGAFTLRSTIHRDPGSGALRIMSRELGQDFSTWPAPASQRENDAYGP